MRRNPAGTDTIERIRGMQRPTSTVALGAAVEPGLGSVQVALAEGETSARTRTTNVCSRTGPMAAEMP